MTDKKPWTEPELIVLVRSNPEEAILGVCKEGPGVGPSNSPWGCVVTVTNCDVACGAPSPS